MIPSEPPLSPCHFFQFQSRYVWERIAFARRMNLSVRETTITEELLYHFFQYFETFRVPLRLFESKEEYRNGSDIEILIKTESGYILLACQAKITYKSGNYKAFHHYVGGARQIDLLRDYAARHGGIAQYLFYNFMPDWMMPEEVATLETIEDQGITYLAANGIIDWMEGFERGGKKPPVPGFTTFHPHAAKPLHELICNMLNDDKAYLRNFPNEANTNLTFYDEDEVSDAENWQRVTSLAKIGYVEETLAYSEVKENTDIEPFKKQEKAPPIFKPKFRLVIGGQNSGGAIFSIE